MKRDRPRLFIVLLSAALFTGAALFFILRTSPDGEIARTDGRRTPATPAGSPEKKAVPSLTKTEVPFVPPLALQDAQGMSTAEVALGLAGWPEGKIHPDLPKWTALLAERGPEAVGDIASALATAGSNTARGVLADALARIGTDEAIQQLCTEAVKVPDDGSRQAIAAAFRALSRPAAAPMLATLFSEEDSGTLITEASSALRRLTDEAGVHALADLAHEGGQLYSQRDNIFRVLATLENPDALAGLEVLAVDTTDPERAKAAAAGVVHLKAVIAGRGP